MRGPGPLIWAACDVGLGRRYGHHGNESTDCCRFALAAMEACYRAAPWTPGARRDVLISHGDPTRPFSPISAVVSIGIGTRCLPAPDDTRSPRIPVLTPGRWHLCQGWRRLTEDGQIPPPDGKLNGHEFFWWVPRSGGGFIMEATNLVTDWLRPENWDRWASRYTAGVQVAALRPATYPWGPPD